MRRCLERWAHHFGLAFQTSICCWVLGYAKEKHPEDAAVAFESDCMNGFLFLLSPVVGLADAPEAWQLGSQDPATPVMQGLSWKLISSQPIHTSAINKTMRH